MAKEKSFWCWDEMEWRHNGEEVILTDTPEEAAREFAFGSKIHESCNILVALTEEPVEGETVWLVFLEPVKQNVKKCEELKNWKE